MMNNDSEQTEYVVRQS